MTAKRYPIEPDQHLVYTRDLRCDPVNTSCIGVWMHVNFNCSFNIHTIYHRQVSQETFTRDHDLKKYCVENSAKIGRRLRKKQHKRSHIDELCKTLGAKEPDVRETYCKRESWRASCYMLLLWKHSAKTARRLRNSASVVCSLAFVPFFRCLKRSNMYQLTLQDTLLQFWRNN